MALGLIDRVTLEGAMLAAPAWLRSRRNRYRGAGERLRGHELGAYGAFFSPGTLESVRVARVDRFEPWPLESAVGRLGLRGLVASQMVAGIALIDTVVLVIPMVESRRVSIPSLLFHELVHIEQYRVLGVRGFLRAYLGGWLAAGRSYLDIPLEEQAYALTERYEDDPGSPFSVEEEIRLRL